MVRLENWKMGYGRINRLALALVVANNLTEAAAEVGVSRATAFRLVKQPGFLDAYNTARRAYLQEQGAMLARQHVVAPTGT
jgi:hypothetical protein